MLFSIFFSVCLFNIVYGGNLLVLHFIPTSSSVQLLNGILESLAPYHKITIYSVMITDNSHSNVTVVKLNVPPVKSPFQQHLFEILKESGPFQVTQEVMTCHTEEFIHSVFNTTEMQSLLHTRKKYDMILTYVSFSEFVFRFAHLLRAPLIQIAPTMLFAYSNNAVGNSMFQTSTYTVMNFERSSNFFNRVKIYMNNIIHCYKYFYEYLPYINKITNLYFPPETPSIEEIHFNTSLWLTNVNRALGYVKPNMPHVLEIGGIFCRPPKALPSDLEEFISGAGDNGIIYVSFGSSILSRFPDYFKNSLIKVFAKLPQRILWKWNEDIVDLPPNVRVSKWFRQQDILGHKMIKLFIMQGGILSLQESVYHQTPVLMIPIVIDQHYNSYLANQLGYGESIDFLEYSEEKLLNKIREMLTNSKYKENVNRISKLMKEELDKVNDTLRNEIDYIIRHKGNPIIQQIPNRLSGLQRMDVDIVVFLVFLFLLILTTGVSIIYLSHKSLCKLYYYKEKQL